MFERPQSGEKAVLVHLSLDGAPEPEELQEFTELARSAGAEPLATVVAPALQAASNFGQTWNPVVFEAARAAGITALRDEVHWDYGERDGAFVFDHEILTYPGFMAEADMRLTLIALGGAVTGLMAG